MVKCLIPDCNEMAHYEYLQLCKACYSGFFYWRDRSPDEIEDRIRALYRLSSRLENMLERGEHPIRHRKYSHQNQGSSL